MSLVLARIDDRLIHGQVVEGWLRVVQAVRIVVASDEVSADPLQESLMRLAVPPGVQVKVLPVREAAESFKRREWEEERVLLLMPGLKEARRLVELGVAFESINLGGLHDAPGRSLVTPSLALGEQDRSDIRAIRAKNVPIETRSLPGDERRPIEDFLGTGGN